MRVTKKIRDEQLAILEETYRGAKPELIFRNPFELLIAVILSAQCTDKRVNVTTKRLFAKVKSPEDIVAMGLPALENEIRDCGLFRNKAKNILAACQMLCTEFGGAGRFRGLAAAAGRRAQDGQCRHERGLPPSGHRGRYARLPHRQPAAARDGLHAAGRGAGAHEEHPEGEVVGCAPLAHLARPQDLQGAKARLRYLPARARVPECRAACRAGIE